MNPLRIAVIGAGHLGKIHARLLSQNPRAELVAVVDTRLDQARIVAQDVGTAFAASYDLVVPEIEAAVIAAPTSVHESIALELLSSGIHVFIEKPITANSEQADRVVRLAKQKDLKLQVGHVEQFNPAWQRARQLLDQASFITACRHGKFTFRSTDVSVVQDLMIHDIELVLSVIDSPVSQVRAWGQSVVTNLEDVVSCFIEFEDGRAAHLSASRIHHCPVRTMQMHCGAKQLAIDFASGTVSEISPSEAARMPIKQTAKGMSADEVMTIHTYEIESANAICGEHEDFIEAIRFNREPLVSGTRGQRAVALAEQILVEVRNQSPQRILRPAA